MSLLFHLTGDLAGTIYLVALCATIEHCRTSLVSWNIRLVYEEFSPDLMYVALVQRP